MSIPGVRLPFVASTDFLYFLKKMCIFSQFAIKLRSRRLQRHNFLRPTAEFLEPRRASNSSLPIFLRRLPGCPGSLQVRVRRQRVKWKGRS
jgi:hypothetical protein